MLCIKILKYIISLLHTEKQCLQKQKNQRIQQNLKEYIKVQNQSETKWIYWGFVTGIR